VFTHKQSNLKVTSKNNRTFRVNMEQFPLSPMDTITGHGTQGTTYKHPILILDIAKSDRMWVLYVMLSRVTKLSDIILAEPVDVGTAARVKHYPELEEYMKRVEERSMATQRQLEALLLQLLEGQDPEE